MGFFDDQRHHDLPTVLDYQVQHRPDKPWILSGEQAFSYREVDNLSGRLAQGLSRIGVAPGDTVLCMSQNRVEQVFLWCALAKCGAPLVPVNTHYRGNIFSYLINDSLAETIAIEAEFLQQLVDVWDELLHLKRVILIAGEGESPGQVWEQIASRYETYQYSDILDDALFEGDTPGYRDFMGVFYTSGTTGRSKGVTMTHAHAFEYARGVTEMLELREDDVYCSPLPLFHIAGLLATVYAAGIVGASTVIVGPFSVERFWQDAKRYRVTATFLLGAMANFIYKQPTTEQDADNTLERVLMVPLIPEVETFKDRFDCMVSTTWGGTEMNCPTQSGFELADNKTCGRVLEDRYEVKIVDEFDHEVPYGTPGEALVRTKVPWIATNGYWQHPEWTAALLKNQWIHTGDMLFKDENGNLYFVDRTKDAIRRRGENISSMEVENEVNAHDQVVECAVVPVASTDTEQEVLAVIVLQPEEQIDPGSLIRFLEPRLPYFMIPRYVRFVDALPKTPTGKIQKYVVRELGLPEGTWDREAAGVKLKR
ncbi:MAG TPA: ATP-dependent acyl-CoA ligase [Gammaproteobacteria bacterium]|jgi:crotonobetaine/carnitine-CoA ligase|nr:AMP-binding protein [Arenicellales bacterium]HCX87034.1 ATP-dependent acyl-CoA ligase [Gammaproteobacteria bacterium]|tara:strand:+ start:15182 stop:16795 length:1614 start_codon:yes stop_codon:yes gene_type:complete